MQDGLSKKAQIQGGASAKLKENFEGTNAVRREKAAGDRPSPGDLKSVESLKTVCGHHLPTGAVDDMMAATISHYKSQVEGPARKFLTLHLIVRPEYLKRVSEAHPSIEIYSIRLDRSPSAEAILRSPPGKHWDQEKGLNEHDYIVPGGGGFGEIMDISFV
jgi:hypothetical protein